MSDADWAKEGTHPEHPRYSVDRWLEIYAEHAHNHADQITRARASGAMNPSFTCSISIIASPGRVMWAFFDPAALASWWQASRSVTIPRVLGAYAVEWEPTEFKDEMLGRLGGTFHGTVMEYKPDREFFVAEAFWLPPDGNPIGPMALEVTCEPQRTKNPQITLRQGRRSAASEDGDRWKRYYEVIAPGWERALQSLKRYLESLDPSRSVLHVDEILIGPLETALALMNTTTDPGGTSPRLRSSSFSRLPVVSTSLPMPVISGTTPR